MTHGDLQPYGGIRAGTVQFPGDGQTLNGYLAAPSDGHPHPGVILLQEWWGIDPWVEEVSRRLAAEGFVVLAPDLYHGQLAQEPAGAMTLASGLDREHAVAEIGQAVDYLQSRDDVQPKRVGVVGFCMGGRYAWWAVEHEGEKVGAAAPFYAGGFQPTAEEIARVQAPVLVVWGSEDQSTPPEQREHIVDLLQQEGKTFKTLLYPAGHAFMNDQRPSYIEDAAKRAWPELLDWFRQHLR